MMRTPITHPELLAALARCGHGTKILIADGNYPHVTGVGPHTTRIALNVAPGLLTADQVLELLIATVPVEAAEYMENADGAASPAVEGYGQALGPEIALSGLERFTFYDRARENDVAVVIATGEQRQYANLLLTVGVIPETRIMVSTTGAGRAA